MKVFLHVEDEDESKCMTIKLTLPKSWKQGPVSQLQDVLVDSYNKKHKDNELNKDEYHMENSQGKELASDACVEESIGNQEDVYLRKGPSKTMKELDIEPPKHDEESNGSHDKKKKPLPLTENEKRVSKLQANKPAKVNDGSVLCKRFGCNKRFKPEENDDHACRHHVKPPVFHETRKFWACCPDSVAWDWETFMAIPGCEVSCHSTEAQGQSFLGGTDVRAQQAEEMSKNGPQRLDQPSEPPKELSALDKLSQLRGALVKAGVPGNVFDAARDRLKSEHESLGASVWDQVFKEIGQKIKTALES